MPLGAFKTALMGAAGGGDPRVAYGGRISQWTTGGTTYRSHTFYGSGDFIVTGGSADVDMLIVAGGGAGGGASPGGSSPPS